MKLLDTLIEERAELAATQEGIVTRAADEARDLTETEDTNLSDLKTRADELDDRIAQLRSVQVSNLEAAKIKAEVAATDDPETRAAAGIVSVGDEPLTYTERSEASFFSDLYRSTFDHDPASTARIARHQAEMAVEMRDSTSANFAGLVVPQYITSLAAELARAGRPFANICNRLPLPADGLTVNVSRITTGSTAAPQAAEGDTANETTPDDTLLTVNVRTIAASVDLSRQAIERGVGTESLIVRDMASAYATELDNGIINDDGTSGTHLGVLNTANVIDVDVDDASPTAAETYTTLVKAITEVNSQRYRPADIIVMHPRRWGYLYGGLDGSSRPLLEPSSAIASNPIGLGDAAAYGQVVGNIAGVPVVTDANIPTNLGAGTNEDRVIVARSEDLLLFEQGDGGPMSARYESVGGGELLVKLVAYGYSAFTAGRYPKGIAVCQGTTFAATL